MWMNSSSNDVQQAPWRPLWLLFYEVHCLAPQDEWTRKNVIVFCPDCRGRRAKVYVKTLQWKWVCLLDETFLLRYHQQDFSLLCVTVSKTFLFFWMLCGRTPAAPFLGVELPRLGSLCGPQKPHTKKQQHEFLPTGTVFWHDLNKNYEYSYYLQHHVYIHLVIVFNVVCVWMQLLPTASPVHGYSFRHNLRL